MVPPPYAAEPGHWFLRGVQSAIFYYVSFTPCLEYQHKRKRRKEAEAQAEIVTTQPGLVRQPGPFQTNETWAEELILGPGPPKGWKADGLLQKLKKSDTTDSLEMPRTPTTPEPPKLHPQPTGSSLGLSRRPTEPSTRPSSSNTETTLSAQHDDKSNARQKRPSMDRRLSNAMENIKDSLKATLHPEKWNWKRYDREDEVLWDFSERVTRMWNRATSGVQNEAGEGQEQDTSTHRRKRAATNESDRYDYGRARNPELNELHPPVVSQLPANRDEAAWMMLPPPSAAVMAGKRRPGAETEMRWPLAVIGKDLKLSEPPRHSLAPTHSRESIACDTGEDDSGISDADIEAEIDERRSSRDRRQRPRPSGIKHMSDPIIRPPAIYAKAPSTDDLLVSKRRDPWQIHYYLPSDHST